MSAATPVKRNTRSKGEVYPDAEKPAQVPDIDLGMGNTPFDRPKPDIVVAEPNLEKDYLEELAFLEEPVTVHAYPSPDPFAPMFVQGWVNGKGVERWIEGLGWVEVKHIPVNEDVIVKRKYVDQWLRGRTVNVQTLEDKADGSEPRNMLNRHTLRAHTIHIRYDANPKGIEWAKRLQRM